MFLQKCFQWLADRFDGDPDPIEKKEIDRAVDRVDELLKEILAQYKPREIGDSIKRFGEIILPMAHLVNQIIWIAEEFEDKTGPQKKAFVKEVSLALYRKHPIDFPGIPSFLEPFFFEMILDFAINYMVQMFNMNFGKNWAKSPQPKSEEAKRAVSQQLLGLAKEG